MNAATAVADPSGQISDTNPNDNLKALCERHGVAFVAVQPKLRPASTVGPLLLFNVPDCRDTTWTCPVVEAGQAAALAAAIAACRERWGRGVA